MRKADMRKMRRHVRRDQLRNLLLSLKCISLRREYVARPFGVEALLFRQIRPVVRIDVEPCGRLERLQSDREGLRGAVIGCVGKSHSCIVAFSRAGTSLLSELPTNNSRAAKA